MSSDRRIPQSTYRLQLTPEFGFAAAAAVVPYLAELGVSHVYCSPVLQAAPGSTHGYDVVDHGHLNGDLGGADGFAHLVAACREHDLGIVVDVVPNHAHVGAPEPANPAWWDLLRRGKESPFASWFDVDWDAPGLDGKVLVPVLGDDPKVAVDNGELRVDGDLLRYHEHAFPLADGTAGRPLPELLDAQHYRLAHWREAAERLNYRRFFDIATLGALRVEHDAVFGATHNTLLRLVGRGVVDGLRIDHPDGLADPAGYLQQLAETTDGCWVVVEKILEGDEQLPHDWRCAGTTGYDAATRILGLLVDADGERAFTDTYRELTGAEADWHAVEEQGKRDALQTGLRPEVNRLARLVAPAADHPEEQVVDALRELLVAMPVYRAYVRPDAPVPGPSRQLVEGAARRAAAGRPDLAGVLGAVAEAVLTGPAAAVVRFQQTCGPVMAKGLEDTAFYRYHRFVALNEVGGAPGRFGADPESFHAFCEHLSRHWPATMTTLSTHDTKRSEDVRARLAVLSEVPDDWRRAVERWLARAASYRTADLPDRNTEYLLWQTFVGAWPLSVERARSYAEKATREAKQHTAWVDGDPAYDEAVRRYVTGVLEDDSLTREIEEFVARCAAAATSNSLSQKLLQLTMPGVPDVYQGCESVDLSLVDPDNRRPVDFATRAAGLRDGVDRKQQLVATALRARREHPEWFGAAAAYTPLRAEGAAARHAVAFQRGDGAVAVATRLPVGLERTGGWAGTTLCVPDGGWTDLLAGHTYPGGRLALSDLLQESPVALLGRTGPSAS